MRASSLTTVFRALNDQKVSYLVVGGLAVVAHGYGRLTYDLDLVVRLVPENIILALEILGSLGFNPRVPVSHADFANPEVRARLITEKNMQVLNLHNDSIPDLTIDVFVREPFDFEQELKNALVEEISDGVPVPFVGLTTLIEMKRAVGRPRDLDDVEHLELLRADP